MKNENILELKNFNSGTSGQKIIKGINLVIKKSTVHAIMGPNGSGKSTLAMSIIGHPSYQISRNSKFKLLGKDAMTLTPEEKAKLGLFVSFQNPIEITGVSFLAFVRTAYKALYPKDKLKLSEFKQIVRRGLKKVDLDISFMHRYVNEGFSGGEKKRAEIAQILILKPKIVILDEIDSGLDVDSLRVVAKVVSECVKSGMTVLIITHYQRILHYLRPDSVHVLKNGKIKKTGNMKLVKYIEENGYAEF